MCGTGVSRQSQPRAGGLHRARPPRGRTRPGSPGRASRGRPPSDSRRGLRQVELEALDPRQEPRQRDDRRRPGPARPEAESPSSSRRPARSRRGRRGRSAPAVRRGSSARRAANVGRNVSGSGVGMPPRRYQWRAARRQRERPARRDPEQPPLRVERVEQRAEIVLVGARGRGGGRALPRARPPPAARGSESSPLTTRACAAGSGGASGPARSARAGARRRAAGSAPRRGGRDPRRS